MSDTMPERVWVGSYFPTLPNPMTAPCWLSDPALAGDDDPFTPYVPEQRALDAERELSNMAYEYNMLSSQSAREIDLRERAQQLDHITMDALRAERDALQADLKALLPLARLGAREQELWFEKNDEMPNDQYLDALAILDRERA